MEGGAMCGECRQTVRLEEKKDRSLSTSENFRAHSCWSRLLYLQEYKIINLCGRVKYLFRQRDCSLGLTYCPSYLSRTEKALNDFCRLSTAKSPTRPLICKMRVQVTRPTHSLVVPRCLYRWRMMLLFLFSESLFAKPPFCPSPVSPSRAPGLSLLKTFQQTETLTVQAQLSGGCLLNAGVVLSHCCCDLSL